MRRWFVRQDADTWQLFFMYTSPDNPLLHSTLQIIKARKKDNDFAPYYPDEEETKFIVDALNAAEAIPPG